MNLNQRIKNSPFWENAIIAIPVFLFLIFYLTFSFIRSSASAKKFRATILKHYQICTGKILYYTSAVKQTGSVTYEFWVNGKYFEGVYGSGQFLKLGSLMYTTFPVIYNIEEPEKYNEILVFPDQFEKYNLTYPDSLLWVKRRLE